MLLSLTNVSKLFAADIVLERANLVMDRREKVALVGRNGTGKTTLLNILNGSLEPDTGSVHVARGAKIGFMKQESPVDHGRTVIEEVESALQDQFALRNRLQELEVRMEGGASDEDIEEYGLLHEHFLDEEGYSMDHDVRSVLTRMGFEECDWSKPTNELSGGQKTRLSLARLLLEEPDLLILDEPTNHLDLQATEWLESWIRKYHGAVLIVSHDREFLQNTVDRVVEIRDHATESFPGSFEKYLVLREERDEQLRTQAKKQGDQIAKLDEYVRRFMNSQRTAQARGRLKQKDKLVAQKISVPKNSRSMGASIISSKRSGDIVADCNKLVVGYDGVGLFAPLDWSVRWGERWGVIGENGSGKSTLIKTLAGSLPPVSGSARLGSSVELGYFAQEARFADLSLSPLQYVTYECDLDVGSARDLLGRFLIEGDDVFRPIKTLSGGEKNKLALAAFCNLSPNLLILDEPTNHLDIASREALAQALTEYKGTLIIVSHDRWLLRKLTNHTLDVRKSGAISSLGGYDEYRSKFVSVPSAPTPKVVKRSNLSPREISKTIQKKRADIVELEWKIAELENHVADSEARLSTPKQGDDFVKMAEDHQCLQSELASALKLWEDTSHEIDALEAEQSSV